MTTGSPRGGPSTSGAFRMRRGALAVLDVLGFKRIWDRHDPAAVVRRLEQLNASMRRHADALAGKAENAEFLEYVGATFLSDTVVFGVAAHPPEAVNVSDPLAEIGLEFDALELEAEAVGGAARLAAMVQREAVQGDPPFALRGCIAFGDFGMTDRFIIGRAVDEAASCHERAQGAIVWLAPSAARFDLPFEWWEGHPVARRPVPMKGKARPPECRPEVTWVDVPAVLPLGYEATEFHRFRERIAATFQATDPEIAADVTEKRDNTLHFLDAAWASRPAATRRTTAPVSATKKEQ